MNNQGPGAHCPGAANQEEAWYEKDCDWSIVVLAFPDVFPDVQDQARRTFLTAWRQ